MSELGQDYWDLVNEFDELRDKAESAFRRTVPFEPIKYLSKEEADRYIWLDTELDRLMDENNKEIINNGK